MGIKRHVLGVLVGCCALLTAEFAAAGGFSIPIIGARMTARGGAFVARADDTTANYHNVAGLSFLDSEYSFDVSVASIYSHTVYRLGSIGTDPTTGNPRYEYTEPIYLEKPHGYLPYAGFAGDFGLDRWTFGFAMYSPNNAATSLPREAPTNFQLIEGQILTLHFNPNVAYRISDKLSVGVGFSYVTGSAYIERLRDFEDIVGRSLVALLELDAAGDGFAWNAGLMYHPNENLSLGLSYLSTVTVKFEGSIDFDATKDYLPSPFPLTFGTSDGSTTFDFPQQLRAGVEYKFTDRFSLGFDLMWTDYSIFESIDIEIENIEATVLGAPLTVDSDTTIVEPKNSEDIWTVSFGATLQLHRDWELHGGVLYDQSPYPDETYTILSPDADKTGFSIGTTYSMESGFTATAAYTRLLYNDRVVTQSVLTPAANGSVIGKFTNIFSLSVGWRFGKRDV